MLIGRPWPAPAYRAVARIGLALILATSGCGRPVEETGQVSGQVTYQGKPVTEARIGLNDPDRGYGALADLDDSGRFTFSAPIPTGTYIVSIQPPVGMSPLMSETTGSLQAGTVDVPPKFLSEMTSDLKVEVKSGDNDFPLTLE